MGFFKSRQEKEVPDTHEEPHYHHPHGWRRRSAKL